MQNIFDFFVSPDTNVLSITFTITQLANSHSKVFVGNKQ